MSELDKTLEIIRTLLEKCPVDRVRDSKNLISHLKEELDEVIEAHSENDAEHLAEETGDLLFTLLMFIEVLEKEKSIDLSKILAKTNKKMTFRHPHVFSEPREVSIEEANLIWKEQKRKEREEKIIH